MTIVDQVKAYTRTLVQSVVDKEPLSYTEAAALYGTIIQGRHNITILSSFYNQAEDSELKKLIKEAIEEQTVPALEKCEELMRAGGAELPDVTFPPHRLYEGLEYPAGLRLTDKEIALALANLARASQLTLFLSLQQCYQLEVASGFNQLLNSGLQWDYRLLQLMLHRGWLPHVAKVKVEH